MDTENEDITVELEPTETPAEETVVVEKTNEEPKPEAPSVDETMEELKAQLASEREARIAADQRAANAATQAHFATNRAHESDLNLVTNAIGQLEQTQDVLKNQLAGAFAEQDYDLAANIQTAIAANAANLSKLRDGKQALEIAPKPEAPMIVDPVKALASQLSPRSGKWVTDHPEFAQDPVKYQRMLAAHNLVKDEVEVDSDAYFDRINALLGVVPSDASNAPQRQSAPPAAPVSRGGNGTGSNNPNVVRLTAEEREIARMNGMTEKEYAQNKLALQREGKLH